MRDKGGEIMNYKHSHVINADGYKTAFVLVHILEDDTEQIQHYTLKDGERLVDTPPPADIVKPRWNGIMWRESATAEEIAATLPTLDELRQAKKAEIANARWQQETGGLTIPGLGTIATDRESQSLLNGAVTGTLLEPDKPIKWKMMDGAVELDAATVQMIGKLVRSHVQACFDREIDLIAAINACQTAEEVTAVAW